MVIIYFCAPHEPGFHYVYTSATLNGFVSAIERHIIVLVFLEEIRRVHRIALKQKTLQSKN